MSTIHKISELTGFSYAVVARALSGKGYCNAEKREKILQVAHEIGYTVNHSAKALRSNRTEKILFCIPDICNSFYFKMIQQVTEVIEPFGYYCMICDTRHSLKREVKYIGMLQQKYCDGIIFVSFDLCKENIAAIRETGRPVVLATRFEGQRPDDNFDYVYSDHIKGMRLATEHLLDAGCQRLLLIAGDPSELTSKERIRGFREAFASRGLECPADSVVDGGFNADETYERIRQLYRDGGSADGVITASENIASGVCRFFNEEGIRMPEDVRLVTFDNTNYTEALGLTCVDLRQDLLGKYAAELLMERIAAERNTAANRTIDPVLVLRRSSPGR